MDRPVLHAFVQQLVEHERLAELVEALPTRVRVSEPALPLLLASLHERLERGLVVLLPEDADARDAAEGASWFLGGDSSASGRGLSTSSSAAGSSVRRRAPLPRGCLRRKRGPSRSSCARASS